MGDRNFRDIFSVIFVILCILLLITAIIMGIVACDDAPSDNLWLYLLIGAIIFGIVHVIVVWFKQWRKLGSVFAIIAILCIIGALYFYDSSFGGIGSFDDECDLTFNIIVCGAVVLLFGDCCILDFVAICGCIKNCCGKCCECSKKCCTKFCSCGKGFCQKCCACGKGGCKKCCSCGKNCCVKVCAGVKSCLCFVLCCCCRKKKKDDDDEKKAVEVQKAKSASPPQSPSAGSVGAESA